MGKQEHFTGEKSDMIREIYREIHTKKTKAGAPPVSPLARLRIFLEYASS